MTKVILPQERPKIKVNRNDLNVTISLPSYKEIYRNKLKNI